MFGKQGVVPGITDGNPASLEAVVESDSFRKELINRQKSEELFRKIDSNERIQKSLAQRTYGYSDNKYLEGNLVLFKENDKGRWSGPAKVTGMEGNKVRIIHAGYDRTVPTCRVMPFEDEREVVEDDAVVEEEICKTAREDDMTENQMDDDLAGPLDPDNLETNREVRPKRNRKIVYKIPGELESFSYWKESWEGKIQMLD